RTKIVCTLGPSTNTPDMIENLIRAGMNVVRINFSHGTQEEHGATIRMVRDTAKKCGCEVAILADLQGPKIRTNRFPGGFITLEKGEEVKIIHSDSDGKKGVITTNFAPLITDVNEGETILMDDGMIKLSVIRKEPDALICSVVYGGALKDRKGINLPHTKLKVTAMTDKDRSDAQFVLPLGVDFIALSFVRSAEDVEVLRDVIHSSGYYAQIVAKIEKPEAIIDLNSILLASDAVMVARGDLAVEAGNEKVPGLQKLIIKQALSHGLPVITATQMLESMIQNPTPTRAEASDVANAIFDGTDAVMLSGETAMGKYPVETVEMMKKIILDAESKEMFFNFDDWSILDKNRTKFGMAVAKAATFMAKDAGAKAFGAYSHTGKAAIRLTAQRPSIPVYVFSTMIECVRRMNLVHGAYGIHIGRTPSPEKVFHDMEKILLKSEYIDEGDTVVYTTGIPMSETETTNTVHIRVAQK
ncbi:MAG: pyruvate kinase, partial [Spirochaetota bacterium]